MPCRRHYLAHWKPGLTFLLESGRTTTVHVRTQHLARMALTLLPSPLSPPLIMHNRCSLSLPQHQLRIWQRRQHGSSTPASVAGPPCRLRQPLPCPKSDRSLRMQLLQPCLAVHRHLRRVPPPNSADHPRLRTSPSRLAGLVCLETPLTVCRNSRGVASLGYWAEA